MALQTFNFASSLPTPGIPDYLADKMSRTENVGKELQNVFDKIRNETAREKNIADINHTKAQTGHTNALTSGAHLGNKLKGFEVARAGALQPYIMQALKEAMQESNAPQTEQNQQNQGADTQALIEALQQIEQGRGPSIATQGNYSLNPAEAVYSAQYEGMMPYQEFLKDQEKGKLLEKILQSQSSQEVQNAPPQSGRNKFAKMMSDPLLAGTLKQMGIESPLNGMTGAAGNLARLYQAEQMLGSNHPAVAQIRNNLELERRREEQLLQYQKGLTNTLQYRSSPPLQKTMMDIDALKQGKKYDKDGNEVKLTPKQAAQEIGILSKEITQKITDEKERDRLRYGNVFQTAVRNIDPVEMFKYSGGLNGMAKALQKGKGALTLQQSEAYKKFEENLTRMQVAGHTLSQFYSQPAAEGIQKAVHELVNPEIWFRTPEIAIAKYNALMEQTSQEHLTMLQNAVNSSTYGLNLQNEGYETVEPYQAPAHNQNKSSEMITITNPVTKETKTITRAEYEANGGKKK